MTEASSVFTMNTGEDLKQRPDSVGRPFATAQLRVVDEDGTPLPTGETGEVQVRGPFLMREYWEAPEATTAAFAPGGWLRTGDLGRLDEEGFLYLSGRQKDIIIRGGENILAEEVERCLEDHPGILEAAVIGVPSETLGEELKAVLVTGGPDIPDELAVREWVGRSLAHFKVPRYVEFRDAPLPRNAAGKIDHRLVDQLLATGQVVEKENQSRQSNAMLIMLVEKRVQAQGLANDTPLVHVRGRRMPDHHIVCRPGCHEQADCEDNYCQNAGIERHRRASWRLGHSALLQVHAHVRPVPPGKATEHTCLAETTGRVKRAA